jgi:hypothetical protein
MESVKYIGLDVHQSTISVAVLNTEGKLMMQSVIATKATAGSEQLSHRRLPQPSITNTMGWMQGHSGGVESRG